MRRDQRCNYIQVHCKVTHTYLPVLEKYQSVFGGNIRLVNMEKKAANNPFVKCWKQQYHWELSSYESCGNFLNEVLPFLGEKKPKAEEVLRFIADRKIRKAA